MFSPFRGFLVVIVHMEWCMFSPLEAFLLLSYTWFGVWFSPCRGFLDVIVHRDGVCSIL